MRENIHRQFLCLLGWEGKELERFLPDWLNAAAFLQLTEKDMTFAVNEWLPKYWDLSLSGVRKCIAACIREAAELAKMEIYKEAGDQILYTNNTSSYACICANRLAGRGRLHVAYPDFIMTTVWQAFFGKLPEQVHKNSGMSASCSHCALNCTRVASRTGGLLPEPSVKWNWGLHCDEAPKTEELIDCTTGRESTADVLTTIPHDAPLGTMEAEDDSRVAFLAEEIREGQKKVSAITGIPVTEADMRAGMSEYMAYMGRVEKLIRLVVNAEAQPISGNELALFSLCMQVCFDTGTGFVNDALDTVISEVEERIKLGIGVLPKGSPKLACHFVPLNVPWVDKAFRDNGVNLSLGRVFPLASWMEEKLKGEDMYIDAARQCLMCPDAVNMKNEAAIIIKLLNEFSFDGALFGFYDFDRWIGALHKTMIQLVEEGTGVAHYYLEGEFWDGNRYSIEDRISIIRSICNCLKISSI